MRISDQSAAIKLAICDDIGERSYDVTDVAAILVQMLTKLPAVGMYIMACSQSGILFWLRQKCQFLDIKRVGRFLFHGILFRISMLKVSLAFCTTHYIFRTCALKFMK